MRIAQIGWGTVGSAFGALVADGPLPARLTSVTVRDPGLRGDGAPVRFGTEPDLANADVLVELAGGMDEPLTWARNALDQGLPVITANKAMLATHGADLAARARRSGAALLASASVGGGTPMLETLAHLASHGHITRLRGLLNATNTFILSGMAEGRSYADALLEAQDAGYAEADPTADVGGHDAAQKLAILATVAWGAWRTEAQVETAGISQVAVAPGEIVRLVASATPERMTVAPERLAQGDALARVSGIGTLLEVDVAEFGTVSIGGPGAGGRVTAGAVYADLARLVAGERPILGDR
jgi:homoserine dehydrogenase